MKRKINWILPATILVAGLTLSACKKTAPATTSTTQTSQSTQQTAQTTSQNAVTIENFAFSPNQITVKAGETINVTNKDSVSHTFTSDDGTSFESGLIAQNETKTVTAPSTPGTYAFHCTPHPNMKGTLVVE